MDYFLELFKSVDYIHFYYVALAALLAAVWCFTRNSRTVNEVNTSTQTNFSVDGTTHIHPEITSKKARAGMYSFFGVVFIAITLFAGLAGYVRQDFPFNYFTWNSKPYEREFVTTGRFKDASTIEIKYDLIITLPDGYQLKNLKNKFQTPEELFNRYMKQYLYAITAFSTAQRTAEEAYETNRGASAGFSTEFTEYIRNQVLNGADPALGLRSSDGYKSFKSYGIKVVVRMIHYTFDPAFLKYVERKDKAKINLEIAKGDAEAVKLQYEAMKGKTDNLMKNWIEQGRDKKKN